MEKDRFSWLTPETLRQAAGEGAFARGAEYHALGQVLSLAEYDGAIAAVVQGARAYRVLLRGGARGIAGRCNCPIGDRGAFCKHCVAAGLGFLEKQSRPESRQEVVLADAAIHLRLRSRDELVELLLAEALESPRLRERLLLDAANRTGKPIETRAYLRAVELALSEALWSEGDEAAPIYLIELKTSLDCLVDAARWDDLHAIVPHALALLAISNGLPPAPTELLREFSRWLHRLQSRLPRKPNPPPKTDFSEHISILPVT